VPYLVRPRRLLAVATGALLAVAGLPAAAHAACPTATTVKAFSQFGDTRDYSLLSGASFESGTSGWTLTKASVISGNESYKVRASTDSHALSVDPKGLVVSPSFCVGIEHPTFRFFARQTSGSWAQLNVKLRWKDSGGNVNETTVGSLSGSNGYSSWAPTPSLALATTLPLWQSGQSVTAQLVLDPEDYGGSWAVDDFYIDPYKRS
jgi:hypothetical protein